MNAEFDAFASLVRRRRTSLVMDLTATVPFDMIERLTELVTWAPNHKRTWPWRLAWFTGDARQRLGDAAAAAMERRGDGPAKVAKTRTKYLRAPGMLVVGSDAGDTPLRTLENREATAAGIQNLLLGATALGLASFWSSCPKGAEPAVAGVCDFPHGTAIVALVYLGWPSGAVAAPSRPTPSLRHITD